MRGVRVFLTVQVLVVCALTTHCAPTGHRAVQTAARLERAFVDEVGPRPDEERVARFLREHSIPYHVDTRKRMIVASLTNVEKQGPVTTGVYLQFAFDNGGRLQSHTIQAVPTGP